MLLTVKIGDIYHGVDGVLNGGLEVTGARAQQGADPRRMIRGPADAAVGGDRQGRGRCRGRRFWRRVWRTMASIRKVMADDLALLTRAEIDLLQQLAQRRDAFDARERELMNGRDCWRRRSPGSEPSSGKCGVWRERSRN